MVDVEKMQKKKKLLFHEGKNKIKGATQVSSEWTFFKNCMFVCLKDHKGSIIVRIVIKVFEIFSI